MKHDFTLRTSWVVALCVAGAVAVTAQVYIGPQVQQDANAGNAATNETTCAASAPTGLDVIAGWNDYNFGGVRNGFGTSIDGGQTYISLVLRPPSGNQAGTEGDPFTIYDPRSGTIWAGGMAFAGNGGIFLCRRNPGQNTFQAPVMAYVGSTDKVWGTAGPDRNNHLLTRLYISHQRGNQFSTDMGQTWSGAVSLGSGIGYLPRVGPQGQVYVAYWDFGSGMRMRRSLTNGTSFTDHLIATRLDVWGTQDGSRFPGNFRVPCLGSLAVDQVSGQLHFVYPDTTNIVNGQRNVDMYYTTSTNEGTTWSTPRVINGDNAIPGDQFFPWIEIDNWGRIHVHHHDSRNVAQNDNSLPGWFDSYYTYSDDNGVTWNEHRLTPNSWRSDRDGFGSGFIGDYSGMGIAGARVWPSYLTTQNNVPDIYSNRIINPHCVPDTITTTRGTLVAGTTESTWRDGGLYRIRQVAQVAPTLANAEAVASLTVGPDKPVSAMTLYVDLAATGVPLNAVRQDIAVYDFANQRYVVLDSRAPTNGISQVAVPIANPNNFVRNGDRVVLVRVGWFDRGTVSPAWEGQIDRIVVKATP